MSPLRLPPRPPLFDQSGRCPVGSHLSEKEATQLTASGRRPSASGLAALDDLWPWGWGKVYTERRGGFHFEVMDDCLILHLGI